MPLQDCIRTDVVTASPDESVQEIARLMECRNVGSVVVTRNEIPIGIVTDRDIVIRVTAKNRDPERTQVRDVMTKDPYVVDRNQTLWSIMSCIREQGVRRLPVVDEKQRLVGIITMDDVVRLLARQMDCMTELIKESAPSAA